MRGVRGCLEALSSLEDPRQPGEDRVREALQSVGCCDARFGVGQLGLVHDVQVGEDGAVAVKGPAMLHFRHDTPCNFSEGKPVGARKRFQRGSGRGMGPDWEDQPGTATRQSGTETGPGYADPQARIETLGAVTALRQGNGLANHGLGRLPHQEASLLARLRVFQRNHRNTPASGTELLHRSHRSHGLPGIPQQLWRVATVLRHRHPGTHPDRVTPGMARIPLVHHWLERCACYLLGAQHPQR